jgi:lipoprotein-anchoring transpeptidase ErfK/SrfK
VTRRARKHRVAAARLVAVAAAGAAALATVVFASSPRPVSASHASTTRAAGGALDVPRPVAPAFTPSRPRLLAASSPSRWAPVARPVDARAAPRSDAPVVAPVPARTPEGTDNILLVVGRATDSSGRLWARVRLAVLPNDTTGWVPRNALGGYGMVRTRLVVDLDAFRATLYRAGEVVFEAPVGVGATRWPTPVGEFYIRNRLTDFADPFYGPVAFGTSARSSVLTDWPAGGFIGIHGTNRPDLVPGAVSHGCIRLRNDDLLELARLMPVGTPVTIHA